MYEESRFTIAVIVFLGLNHIEIKGSRLILFFLISYTSLSITLFKRTFYKTNISNPVQPASLPKNL